MIPLEIVLNSYSRETSTHSHTFYSFDFDPSKRHLFATPFYRGHWSMLINPFYYLTFIPTWCFSWLGDWFSSRHSIFSSSGLNRAFRKYLFINYPYIDVDYKRFSLGLMIVSTAFESVVYCVVSNAQLVGTLSVSSSIIFLISWSLPFCRRECCMKLVWWSLEMFRFVGWKIVVSFGDRLRKPNQSIIPETTHYSTGYRFCVKFISGEMIFLNSSSLIFIQSSRMFVAITILVLVPWSFFMLL